MEHIKKELSKTAYDQRYNSQPNYWEFRPSSMAFKILELFPPLHKNPKVLEIGCGEGGTAIFLARNGYDVTAFDLSSVGVQKTLANAEKFQVDVKVFQADVNEYLPQDSYDIVFSSGTLQYLLPEKRAAFIEACQKSTRLQGLNVLHTFVQKPFIEKAPDAEDSEHLWPSGELLYLYRAWMTDNFIEEIKPCNSSGVSHRHVHNRIWARKI
jgi:tellurite methyltransferase